MFFTGCITKAKVGEAPPECLQCAAFGNGVCTCVDVGRMSQDDIAYIVSKCHHRGLVMDAMGVLDAEHALKIVSNNAISGWMRVDLARKLPEDVFRQCLEGVHGAAAWHIAKSALMQ